MFTYEMYLKLKNNASDIIRVNKNGEVLDDPFYNFEMHPNIFCGSFNPLHDAHRAIFNHQYNHGPKYFEISINNADKGDIPYNIIIKRLQQFYNYADVIISNAPTFLQKAGIFKLYKPNFIIGTDTLARLVRDYNIRGIAGIAANFLVVNRKINNEELTLEKIFNSVKIPSNVNFCGVKLSDEQLNMSSTKIRKENSTPPTI